MSNPNRSVSNMIGTGFVGDTQRRRVLSSSSSASGTPPSSPGLPRSPPPVALDAVAESVLPPAPQPVNSATSATFSLPSPPFLAPPRSPLSPSTSYGRPPPDGASTEQEPEESSARPPDIDPALSLQLRVRWLEALLLGVKVDNPRERRAREKELEAAMAGGGSAELVRKAQEVQRKLDGFVQENEGLKRFMDQYDRHAHLLSPSFALSGVLPPSSSSYAYQNMDPASLEALLSEMELDIRTADRDMREITHLTESKHVLEAGGLARAEEPELQARLEALRVRCEEDARTLQGLEGRAEEVLRRYATRVDALSELFVEWNDVLCEAEEKVGRLEREREEKRRLGY